MHSGEEYRQVHICYCQCKESNDILGLLFCLEGQNKEDEKTVRQ